MDPNTGRAKIIELANLVLGLQEGTPPAAIQNAAVELAEAVHDLDGWLRSGGFLPLEWINQTISALDRLEAVPSIEQDDERPQADGTPCGHLMSHTFAGRPVYCGLDRGHEGAHS